MNYDNITSALFTATAATERFCKAHAANFITYLLVAAVVALQAAVVAFNWLSAQADRISEYRLYLTECQIRVQLFSVLTQRRIVRLAIRCERFRLTIAPRLTAVMDRAFGLV